RARRLPGVPREVPDDVAAAAAGSDEDRLAVDPGGHAEDGPGGHRLPGGEGPAVGVQGDQPAVVLVVVGGVTGGLAEVEEVAPHHEGVAVTGDGQGLDGQVDGRFVPRAAVG